MYPTNYFSRQIWESLPKVLQNYAQGTAHYHTVSTEQMATLIKICDSLECIFTPVINKEISEGLYNLDYVAVKLRYDRRTVEQINRTFHFLIVDILFDNTPESVYDVDLQSNGGSIGKSPSKSAHTVSFLIDTDGWMGYNKGRYSFDTDPDFYKNSFISELINNRRYPVK